MNFIDILFADTSAHPETGMKTHSHIITEFALQLLHLRLKKENILPEDSTILGMLDPFIAILADSLTSPHKKLFLQYLVDYPLGKKVMRQIQFFLGQLEYDREDGRLSALEFLDAVFSTFPKAILNANAPLLFLTLSPRLVNEHSITCVKMVAGVLKKLLNVLEDQMKNELFQIVLLWLQDENVLHRIIAAQLAAIFIDVEGAKFESRLREFIPLLESELSNDTERDLLRGRLLIQLLITTSKLFTTTPAFVRNEQTVQLWREIQKHLLHEQISVRLLSARLIGVLFAAFKPEEIAECLNSKTVPKNMLAFENPVERIRTLALDCTDQMTPLNVETDLTEQVIKNVLFLFKVTARAGQSDENEKDSDDENDQPSTQKKKLFGVRWYVKRIRKEVNAEIAENPNCGVKRTAAFQFYAAALLDLQQTCGPEAVVEHLPTVLPPIVREINIGEDKPTPELAGLATLAREITELLKQLVGHEAYTTVLASCRKMMNTKKIARKAEKSQMAVTNPGLAAKMKIKKQANKKDAKKKKIALLKGKVMKKKKLRDVAVVED